MNKSFTRNLLFFATTLLLLNASLSSYAGEIERVSVDSSGAEGDSSSGLNSSSSISSNGRYVAFSSGSSNLVVGDTNISSDIFVHDRNTGTTTRVSLNTGGTQGYGASSAPSLSADARYVAFHSYAHNLVAGDTNNRRDIFVHDRNTGITTRVSLSTDGTQSDGNSDIPSLSADGRYVTFVSDARNLVAGDTNNRQDIFVHDRNTGITTRVSLNTDGTEGNSRSDTPSLSEDARYVTFSSDSSNLVQGDTNSNYDIFVHDRNTGITTRVSLNTDSTEGNVSSFAPSISADGQFVAFASYADNLVAGDTNNEVDIFVHDRNTGTTTRVSLNTDGTEGNSRSDTPSLSEDGRYVTFSSVSSNLVPGDTNSEVDIFVYDRNTGITDRASLSTDSSQSDDTSSAPSLSTDGRYVTFVSDASNLVLGDTNGASDIFVTPNPLSRRTRNDFDGDGKADILWRHATTGLNYLYLMDGDSIASHGGINTIADLNWQVKGIADFNGDGKADILWRHATTGLNYLYLMNGASIASHGGINTIADLNWQVKGIADFNGDGKADILWRHATTGLNYLYLMNGASIATHGAINTLIDLDWQVKGVADFNGDGKADILLAACNHRAELSLSHERRFNCRPWCDQHPYRPRLAGQRGC